MFNGFFALLKTSNEETLIKKEINILINKIITFLHSIFFEKKIISLFILEKLYCIIYLYISDICE